MATSVETGMEGITLPQSTELTKAGAQIHHLQIAMEVEHSIH